MKSRFVKLRLQHIVCVLVCDVQAPGRTSACHYDVTVYITFLCAWHRSVCCFRLQLNMNLTCMASGVLNSEPCCFHCYCRKRYEARFQTDVHSELLGRLCLGNVVVDREIISGLPDAAVADCLATYHCESGKIKKMSFVWQPRQ